MDLYNNLKWSLNINNSHTQLTNKVLLLRRIQPCITLEMRKLYYNYFISPTFDYGIKLWQSTSKHTLLKIPNIQKRTARMLLDKSWEQPSNQLFKEINWLPLQSRDTYHVALLDFKIHNDLAPTYLNTMLLFTYKTLVMNCALNPTVT